MTQLVREHVARERGGQLDTLQVAALAVHGSAQRTEVGPRTVTRRALVCRRHGRHESGEVVVRIFLVEDVALQLLVERSRRHIGAGAEILLVRQIRRIGAPRIEARIAGAAAGRQHSTGKTGPVLAGRLELIHARTRHLPGEPQAHRLLLGQHEHEIDLGEHVVVLLAFDKGSDRAAHRIVVERVRALVGVDDLQPDVTLQRDARGQRMIEISPDIGGRQLLLDGPPLANEV